MKTTLYFIHLVWCGLLTEYTPVITADKAEAFKELKKLLTQIGFRSAKKNETMEQYLEAFQTFEYRYRNEFDSLTKKEKKANLSMEHVWDPDENEIMFVEREIEVNIQINNTL